MSGAGNLKEVNITRLFNAPRDVVFKAWTDAAQVAKWWGPKDFTNPVCEFELKDGGKIHIDMRSPDGAVHPMDGVFHDIIEPTLLVFTTNGFKDADGRPGLENVNTVTFNEEDHKTRLNLRSVVIRSEGEAQAAAEGMEEGWNQSFDRLEAIL